MGFGGSKKLSFLKKLSFFRKTSDLEPRTPNPLEERRIYDERTNCNFRQTGWEPSRIAGSGGKNSGCG